MTLEVYPWNRGYLVRVGMLAISVGPKGIAVGVLSDDTAHASRSRNMRERWARATRRSLRS